MASTEYYDYYAVVESSVPEDVRKEKFEIESVSKSDSLVNFLRFRGCIMTVGQRNRNRRLWQKEHLDVMMGAPHILEYFQRGGLPGENGHPIPPTAEITMSRLITIDPNNLAILIKNWWWEGNCMMANVETLDQGPGTPGNRMAMNMIQGMDPSFSARTLVPQRRNADGSIDVTGPGRMVTFDRVHGPSCEGAYIDTSVAVKNIEKHATFDNAMENFTDYISGHSEAVKRVLGELVPVMESASITTEGMYTGMNPITRERLIIPVERNLRKEIAGFMMGR